MGDEGDEKGLPSERMIFTSSLKVCVPLIPFVLDRSCSAARTNVVLRILMSTIAVV
jgi:hypothetical protein